MLELGSGSSVKTTILLDALSGLERFVAVDVSESSLVEAGERLAERYPRLELVGVLGDFEQRLPGPFERTLLVCLGSTIGALDPEDRASLLDRRASALGADGRLLLGLDLVKPVERFLAAYDDSEGLSAALIANLLPILNRELGADFDAAAFRSGDRLERGARADGDGRALARGTARLAPGDRAHGRVRGGRDAPHGDLDEVPARGSRSGARGGRPRDRRVVDGRARDFALCLARAVAERAQAA